MVELADIDGDDAGLFAGGIETRGESRDGPRGKKRRGSRGKTYSVASQGKSLSGEACSDPVRCVSVGGIGVEERYDEMRAKSANDRDDIMHERVVRPSGVDDGIQLGEAEVVRAGEVLMGAVAIALREELGRTYDRQRRLPLVACHVDTGFAASKREVRGLDMVAEAQPRDEGVILVLGACPDDEDASSGAETGSRVPPTLSASRRGEVYSGKEAGGE
jgi:hypothetical protein